MQAIRYIAEVDEEGGIALPRLPLNQGTSVEVIVLVQSAPDDAGDLVRASESSLSFWDNDVDDRVWNDA